MRALSFAYEMCPASNLIFATLVEYVRPRHGWEDNIKMDLQEVGRGGIDWSDMAQYGNRWRALVNAIMSLLVP